MSREGDLKIERPDETLRSRVQAKLRDSILDGYFRPGEKLIERELTELTGVSRSILREALVHLEAHGLIERVSFKGFVVARVGPEKVREIYELRSALEAFTAELFTVRASANDRAALKAAGEALQEALAGGDLRHIRNATTRYYDVFFSGAGNSELRRALEPVSDRIFHLRTQSIADPARRTVSAAEMRALTEALLSGDSAAAGEASRRHVEAACEAILARLDGQGSPARK
jgi:DNA-binding GntR family transcriptional regulator